MSNPDDLAVSEGDDISDEPLKVFSYGDQFVSGDETLGLSAQGPDALATLARRLVQSGFDPERRLIILKGSERVGSTTIAAAAGICDEC